MWTLYVLWSPKLQKSYVGITQDLPKRVKRHNSSKAGWTKRGQPWTLRYEESHKTKSSAQKREYFLKSRAGWHELQTLLNDRGTHPERSEGPLAG